VKRSGRVPWVEVRVGLVIVFAFAVMMWAAFQGSTLTFLRHAQPLNAYFNDVGGLVSGSPVWLGGMEVGRVQKIEFVERNGVGTIHVAFEVEDKAWSLVSDLSSASIATMGLMGDKYVSVTVRQPGQPPATPGATLPPSTAGDMTSAFANVPGLMDTVQVTLSHLNAILTRVEHGEGTLGRLTTDSKASDQIDSAIAASKDLMRDLNSSQKRLVTAMERASGSFDSLSDGILHGGGTLSRLIYDSSLFVELRNVSNRADSLVAKWESGSGTMGKLSNDSTLYVEMRSIVGDTRKLIDDIMANPKKYFKFSVF
jgi:phospholipid/cholesterol/gamma-HCH transport system substrate-binding protein